MERQKTVSQNENIKIHIRVLIRHFYQADPDPLAKYPPIQHVYEEAESGVSKY